MTDEERAKAQSEYDELLNKYFECRVPKTTEEAK